MRNLLDVVCVANYSLGHEKAGGKVEVIAWSAHRDRDRSCLPRVGWPIGKLDLKGFFNRKIVQHLPRCAPRDLLDRRLQNGIISCM